jgi:hypothetical protein
VTAEGPGLLISLRLTRDIWRDSTEGEEHFADPALALEAIRGFLDVFRADAGTRQERSGPTPPP